tara:strand:- start:458 stop:910 length:453 start_codon:yes stop_codon:yes gene_type:complete
MTYEYDENVKYEDDKEWGSYIDPLSYEGEEKWADLLRWSRVQITDMMRWFHYLHKLEGTLEQQEEYLENAARHLDLKEFAAEILLSVYLRGVALSSREWSALNECMAKCLPNSNPYKFYEIDKNKGYYHHDDFDHYKDDYGPPDDTSTWD